MELQPITPDSLDDEALTELIELRRCGVEHHASEGNKAQHAIQSLTLIALVELQQRRKADSAVPIYQWRERYEEGNLWDDCTKAQYDGFAKKTDCEVRILYTAPPAPVGLIDDAYLESLIKEQEANLKAAEYELKKNVPQAMDYSADREMLKRLAVIMSGSDSGGEISALTVTAQSLVDRCKALARGKEKLAATESLALGVKCPFPYGWEELKRRINQDTLFFSAYMVEGEEVTDLHRDIVDRMVDRLLKVIAACQTDASYSGPTTWNPASLEEVSKRSVREPTDIPSREVIIAGGVLVQCPLCHGDSYYLKKGGNHYWCDKCANETVTIRDVYMEYRKLVDSLGIDISKQPANVRDAMWYGFSLAKSTGTKMTDGDK